MKYENGFYIFTPKKSKAVDTIYHPFMIPQVIQVIEGVVWVTGMVNEFSIKEAKRYGVIGKMVVNEYGKV